MNILQLVPYFYPAWAYGGPAKLVYDTSKYFAEQGHQVTVYTSDAYDKTSRMPSNLYVHQKNFIVRYFKNFNNYLTYTYNIFITPGLYFKSLLEISKFDVVHIHDFYSLQNFFVGFLARILHKPYVLSVHGCLEEQRVKQQSLFKQFFLHLYGYELLKHASILIASSENEYKTFLKLGLPKKRIVRMAHGINLEEFQTTTTKLDARKKLGLSKDKTIITFLGRIHKIKGLDKLIETITLFKEDTSIQFVIAGSDDGYLETLKESISTNELTSVTLLGTFFGEKKNLLFKASDVFIYPSYSEGFSLGVLEAGAAGLPLIISTGCHFEKVAEKKAGLVVENTAVELKKAVSKMATDTVFRKKAAANAHNLIKDSYSMASIGNQFLSIYEKII